ncbi:MAG: septum formation protein Maf [Planctomycetes bacterium]|nr:septum formation protein Maf [Planctomycetota bacterium]
MATPKRRLILASSSPDRRAMLERAGLSVEVIPSHIDEPTGQGFSDPRHYVMTVSWLKASAVVPQVTDGLVLAADTVGWLDGQVIGKPADVADARRILTALSGREHELWTGVVLWRRPDNVQIVWQECTRLFFRELSGQQLNDYLATDTWVGRSGAYAIQEMNDPYLRIIEGSLTNVIGLPMESLTRNLQWLGYA